jgi:hypothetical protein
MGELDRLGLGDWTRRHTVNEGLRAHGFGQVLELPWPGGSLPAHGSAVARIELDHYLRQTALAAGARALPPAKAVDVVRDGDRVRGVVFAVRGTAGGRCGAPAWWSQTASGRRSAGCSVGSGTATRCTAWPPGRTWTRDGTDRGSPRTSSCAVPPGSCCRLRLDLPARWRAGEPRRRDPGHRRSDRRRVATAPAGVLRRPAPGGVAARVGGAAADLRPAADGRSGERGRRAQLGPDRRRGGLRQPAERRGHRLRAGDRTTRRRPAGRRRRTCSGTGPPCSAPTTDRRSPSPAGSPG